MAKDRVFDADLVIDPREALLQQGYLWTVSNVCNVPKGGTCLFSWQVGSGQLATLDFRILTTEVLIGDLITVNSFSGGEELEVINRNLSFAPTATAPSTEFYLNATPETFTGSGGRDALFTPGTRIPFAPLIVPGPLHIGMLFTNQSPAFDADLNILANFYEQPKHKFPAGDPGP